MSRLELHPDRLLPAGTAERRIARRLYASVRDLPVVSPHGHLDARLFRDNRPFEDPAHLLVTSDHYVVRLLHSRGVPLNSLGVVWRDGGSSQVEGREIWRELCRYWRQLAGTPTRLWLEQELAELFDVEEEPSEENSDRLYDRVSAALAADVGLLPRALYDRFRLEVLATTDSPLNRLTMHEELRQDESWTGRILPTFRADDVVDPGNPCFAANLDQLAEVSGVATDCYDGLVEALRSRRREFRQMGATASDHGVPFSSTDRLERSALEAIFPRLIKGEATPAERDAFRGHLLDEMAAMACEDGLVMQLHVGVVRDYVGADHAAYGSDIGQDFPRRTDFTAPLRGLLSRYGNRAGFQMVLYTVDPTAFYREIGPLASYFPSVTAGAPWWFLDAPDAMRDAYTALGETAGLANLAGFVDDSRSLCSISARHDVARRTFCSYLSRLVAEHRLPEDEAAEHAANFTYRRPRALFHL